MCDIKIGSLWIGKDSKKGYIFKVEELLPSGLYRLSVKGCQDGNVAQLWTL